MLIKGGIVKKTIWKPGTMLYPVPVVMVTCGNLEKSNIITLAWTGTINSEPPMTSISIRKDRFSHDIIAKEGCYTINLVTRELCKKADFCGVKSGRDIDKSKVLGIDLTPASVVSSPLIANSPVNIECVLERIIELGSHDMFMGKVVSVSVANKYIDEKQKLCLDKADLVAYSHGEYFLLGKKLGYFGFSVRKKSKTIKK